MQKSVHISSPHSIVILSKIVGLQMHSLHWVDTGIDMTILHLVLFSLRCIAYSDHFTVIAVWMYKNSTKFEVSWPCLDGLCGSVIWAQSRHPESIHLTSKQFCNFTGCSHPSSRASPFGLDRYMIDLLATWSVFSLKSIAYFDLFTVFSVEFATLDSSMWSKILGPYLFGLWIADFKLFGRNQCIYPLYSILISWDAFGL